MKGKKVENDLIKEVEWSYKLLELKSGLPYHYFAKDFEETMKKRPKYLIYMYIFLVEVLKQEGKWGLHPPEYWEKEYDEK